jgi:iron complex transport system permease protein
MRPGLLEAALLLVVLLLGLASLALGPAALLPWDVVAPDPDRAALARLVMFELRLPRTALAVLAGASLGLAGAALQGLTRNPLADPGVIGISAMAALGAVLAFYFGLWSVVGGGLAGALVAAALLVALAGRDGGTLTLVLAGTALASLAVALTALALNLAPSPLAAYEIMVWLMGAVADRSWAQIGAAVPFILVGWGLLLAGGRGLAALSLGEDVARSLGVDLGRLRLLVVLGTAGCVGGSVAVTGAIGFVGLVVPHLLRPLVGHDPRRLLGASALGGAALLLAADLVVRLLGTGRDLKLGVVTALVGAPFFLALVLKTRARGESIR